ncbi:uncharacterized protein [Drosophila kikkawai]|uniref:Uncharacterized protein isoform X1 n=2 Tax=Drosophila kikkawai TaxID=30033 RepID=A0A6P4JKY6_DROKI|nr:uncharacterized protein LOC108083851 [Drosophila kikkawai]
MASNSTKKSKSSGMRILWIPGRKSHSKGRFSTTNKHISYSGPQKKSEVWSLGGSKAQSELIDLPSPDLAAPSSLSLVATCSLAAQSGKSECTSSTDGSSAIVSETATLPATPVTTHLPNLRPTSSLSEIAPSTPSTRAMTSPNVITTAEIQDFHNFMGPEDLPKVPPAAATGETEVVLNSSAGTTASIATTSSPLAQQGAQDAAHSQQTTPQKIKYKNHNNNQEDINSIESISSFPRFQGNATDFDWIDEMVQQRNCNEMMHKNKRKKAPKKGILDGSLQSEADQLDGQLYSYNSNDKAKLNSSKGSDGDDEKVVKCLYYSLMCCDCTIS